MNEIIEITVNLEKEISNNIEYLLTTEGDEVQCISIENLESILKKYIYEDIKIID